MKRLATALVLIPLLIWLVLFAPYWALTAALAVIGLLAFHEYDRIATGQGLAAAGWPGMAGGLALLLLPEPGIVLVLLAVIAMTLALRVRDLAMALPSAAAFLLGIVYIFGSLRYSLALWTVDHHWLLFALIINWVGDTAAMYVGRAFGRHKLAPRVSPGKSWEGAIASVAGGTLAGAIYAFYLLPATPIWMALAFAALGNIAGQVGDLCESAFKRGSGVKDSGTLLPGHGGWLDRIDSSLFSAPVVYALVKFVAAR